MYNLFVDYDMCDHINRNPLDNRKENLRPVTPTQNAQNNSLRYNSRSGIIGVNWHKRDEVWESHIGVNNKVLYLGRFNDKNDAILARLNAEIKYFGVEFAPQKHLFEQYGIKFETINEGE